MSQPSKPATAYFKAAVKVLRLQRALSRSKGSKSKDSSSTAAPSLSSASCTPTRSSFQHSNGRRLSFNPCQHQHSYHGLHYQPDYDTSAFTVQRRRNNNNTQGLMNTGLTTMSLNSSKPSSLQTSITTSSKHGRRSAVSSAPFPIVSIHHFQSSSSVSLSRSKSMPIARRRKRTSQQPAAAASLSTHLPLHVQHLDQRPPTPTVLGDFDTLNSEPGKESGPSGFVTKGLLTMAPTPVYAVSGQKQGAYSKPSRSHTYSSLNSNSSSRSAFSTAMPLAESNMSIQSHLSEASLLSAVISASGLPTMDVMMDQVDRRVAADSQAQLVENAHVGLVAAQISVVDQDLLLEPCSARIETWVN